jgi:hypothetical protein
VTSLFCAITLAVEPSAARSGQISPPAVDLNHWHRATLPNSYPFEDSYRIPVRILFGSRRITDEYSRDTSLVPDSYLIAKN